MAKQAFNHLENFESLPDSAHVRLSLVGTLMNVSVKTVLRREKAGLLTTHKIGGVRFMVAGDVRRALSLGK